MAIMCMTMRSTKTAFFSSLNVFAKAQGIVKAKHRFLVQHAGYSLRPGINPHFIGLLSTDYSRFTPGNRLPLCQLIAGCYCTYR